MTVKAKMSKVEQYMEMSEIGMRDAELNFCFLLSSFLLLSWLFLISNFCF